MSKRMNQHDVDAWVERNDQNDACQLLDEKIPNMRKRLGKLDAQLRSVLSDVQKVFPDACYYTAGGGFTLVLGDTHEGHGQRAQQQRSCWSGRANISDGDW